MTELTNQKNLLLLSLPISVIIGALIVAGAVVYTKSPQQPAEIPKVEGEAAEIFPEKEPKSEFTITGKDHIQGDFEAPVTIVEFSDFQCPFCQRFHSTVQQILDNYPNQVRWVYKHFPLDSLHSQARPAAEASECVFEQKGNEGFWQFTDGLFKNQSKLGENLYKELASGLGLNMSQFENCFSSREYKDKVEADYQNGIKVGVRGTPGSFINGELISGAVPYETLKAAVDQVLSNL